MNLLEAFIKGMALGIIMSIPIFVANYYLCKRFDKLIKMVDEINCKYGKQWYNRYVSLKRLTDFYK